ncbi:hypothetical protein NP493_88g03006 [Ridgeia piscesae]|uniref:Uncharacterized protein n=1 Tax=Ridgeia piscesae TaxID=27915 RepID=A0AAD9UI63_RIDPI|nr:hypothetical protein NP493_88g03006 [Ridgeia piscesae]
MDRGAPPLPVGLVSTRLPVIGPGTESKHSHPIHKQLSTRIRPSQLASRRRSTRRSCWLIFPQVEAVVVWWLLLLGGGGSDCGGDYDSGVCFVDIIVICVDKTLFCCCLGRCC